MGINDQMERDVSYIYNSYLLAKQDEHKQKYKKFKGWFSASTAGSCFRKQYYNVNGYDGTQPDEKSMRLLRLGTIVHADIANAFERYKEEMESRNLQLYVEHQVILDDLNVVGHLDIGVYDKDANNISVTDIKTAHSYKWKMLFGRNPDKNPSVNYYLQVATYGLGLSRQIEEDVDSIDLSLTWYKKDDSLLRTQRVDNEWIDYAIEYWTELNESLEDDRIPEIREDNVPVYDWECKYCPYYKLHCEGI
jgi:CRISPR/Cas system-associated exonuclease Cas4 (RecB family)